MDWKPDSLRLFISHTHTHRQLAGALRSELGSRGISGFVAHDNIEPTTAWLAEIRQALGSCDGLVALLTIDFHASEWTDHEVGWVLGRGLPVVPVMMLHEPTGA